MPRCSHAPPRTAQTEIAKLVFFINNTASPSPEEVAPLLGALQNCVSLHCMLLTGLTARAGPSLRKAALAAAESLTEACTALARGAGTRLGEQQLMMLAGFALEKCDAAARAPLDNRSAIGRAITLVLRQLADATRELEEVAEAGEREANAAAADTAVKAAEVAEEGTLASATAGSGQAAVAVAVDGDRSEEPLTAEQLAAVKGAQGLLAAAMALVKGLVRALLAQCDGDLSSGTCEAWESQLYHVSALAAAGDDLAAACYMAGVEDVASAAEAVATGAELLVDELPGEPDEKASAELQAALGKVVEAHRVLLAVLAGSAVANHAHE